MTHSTLTSGHYRLTKDLPAVKSDRRRRHDWRARELTAGLLIVVQRERHDVGGVEIETVTAFPSGEYSHYSVTPKQYPALFEALTPVSETPRQWLQREHNGLSLGGDILDLLVKLGKVSLAEIQEAAEIVLNSK
jgi:hypothetical protein